MLTTKACPCCGQVHGFSNWKALHASGAWPIRCKPCEQYFHHAGQGAWLTSFVLVPSTIFAIATGIGFASLFPTLEPRTGFLIGSVLIAMIESALILLYVDRKYTLVPGPSFG